MSNQTKQEKYSWGYKATFYWVWVVFLILFFSVSCKLFLLEMDLGYSRKDEDTGVVAFHLHLQKEVQKEHESLLHSAACEMTDIKKKKTLRSGITFFQIFFPPRHLYTHRAYIILDR